MKFELNDYKQELTDEEILSDIKNTAERLGRDYISISYYRKNGKYSQTAIQHHFGTWKNALSLAGLRTDRNASELKLISDEDYFEDLRRVANLIQQNTVPYDDYRNLADILPSIFSTGLGNGIVRLSWLVYVLLDFQKIKYLNRNVLMKLSGCGVYWDASQPQPT